MQGLVAGEAGTILLFAYDTGASQAAKTGDAANITCKICKDGGAAANLATNTATELQGGYYTMPVSAEESQANYLHFAPRSSTSGVVVIVVSAVVPMGKSEKVGR